MLTVSTDDLVDPKHKIAVLYTQAFRQLQSAIALLKDVERIERYELRQWASPPNVRVFELLTIGHTLHRDAANLLAEILPLTKGTTTP